MLLAHVQGVYVFFLFIFFISVAQGAMSAACKGSMVDFYFSGTHYLLLCIIICYAGGDECCLPTSKGSIVWSMALGGAGIVVYVLGVFVCGRVGAAEQAAAVQRSSGVSDLATRWTSWMTGML